MILYIACSRFSSRDVDLRHRRTQGDKILLQIDFRIFSLSFAMPFTLIPQSKMFELKSFSAVLLSLGEGDQRCTLANGDLKVDGLSRPRSMTWDHVMAAETAISAIRFYIIIKYGKCTSRPFKIS